MQQGSVGLHRVAPIVTMLFGEYTDMPMPCVGCMPMKARKSPIPAEVASIIALPSHQHPGSQDEANTIPYMNIKLSTPRRLFLNRDSEYKYEGTIAFLEAQDGALIV